MALYEKFGEFDSSAEINRKAEELFNAGDLDGLRNLACENGIPDDFTEMYVEGEIEQLCDDQVAAVGKIDMEIDELQPIEILVDWADYIKAVCLEDEDMAKAVRRKGKTLKGCIGRILEWAFKNQQPVDKDIIKAAGVKAGKVTLGMPGQAKVRELIRSYYGGRK